MYMQLYADSLFISKGCHELLLAHGAQHLHLLAVVLNAEVGGNHNLFLGTSVDGRPIIGPRSYLLIQVEAKMNLYKARRSMYRPTGICA